MGLRGVACLTLLLVAVAPIATGEVLAPGTDDNRMYPPLVGPGTSGPLFGGEDPSGIVIPAGTIVSRETFPPGWTDEGPGTLLVDRPLRVLGTAELPVRFQIPVTVTGSGPGELLVRYAIFAPLQDEGACALAIEGSAGRVHNSTFAGSRAGLCLRAAPGSDDPTPSQDAPAAPEMEAWLVPFRGSDFLSAPQPSYGAAHDQQLALQAPGPSFEFTGNAYRNNAEAGLRVAGASPSAMAPPVSIVSRDESFRNNSNGIHLDAERTVAVFQGSSIEGNEVGLLHEGGEARFDHATFGSNRDWDVYSTGQPGEVQFSGSFFTHSCVDMEGREAFGCERGSVGVHAVSMVFALVSALVFLLSEAGRYLLTRIGFGLGLYSRIPKEELLEHESRRILFDQVHAAPGFSIAEIARSVDMPRSTTVYHLLRLERAGLLRSQRDGLYRRFYPIGSEPDEGPESTRETVFSVIAGTPGIHAGGIVRELGLSRQLVSYHVQRLCERGRITATQNERMIRLFPVDGRSDQAEIKKVVR